jgi:hypothetical protein
VKSEYSMREIVNAAERMGFRFGKDTIRNWRARVPNSFGGGKGTPGRENHYQAWAALALLCCASSQALVRMSLWRVVFPITQASEDFLVRPFDYLALFVTERYERVSTAYVDSPVAASLPKGAPALYIPIRQIAEELESAGAA